MIAQPIFRYLLFSISLCLGSLTPAHAQTSDTSVATVRTLQEINRGPKRALLWALIPGGGQVYNKAWWKVPLVYGGLLGVVAVADFNQTQYSRVVAGLEARCLGDGLVIEIPYAECQVKPSEFTVEAYTSQSLVSARDNFNRNRQTAYFAIIGVYILQAVEAFTDAHLRDFDISDDLSMSVRPVVVPGGLPGAAVVIPLGSGRVHRREEARVNALTR